MHVGVADALQARAIAFRSRSWVSPGNTGRSGAVLAWRERREDGVEEVGWEGDPASAAALLDGAADAPAGVLFVEVAALEAFLLELADAHTVFRSHPERGPRTSGRSVEASTRVRYRRHPTAFGKSST